MSEVRYPLTALQKGMVYESLRYPQRGVYVQQLTGRFREALDVPLFKRVWQRLIARHGVLRTRIHLADEQDLSQDVEADAPPEWTEEDWSTPLQKRATHAISAFSRRTGAAVSTSHIPALAPGPVPPGRDRFHVRLDLPPRDPGRSVAFANTHGVVRLLRRSSPRRGPPPRRPNALSRIRRVGDEPGRRTGQSFLGRIPQRVREPYGGSISPRGALRLARMPRAAASATASSPVKTRRCSAPSRRCMT